MSRASISWLSGRLRTSVTWSFVMLGLLRAVRPRWSLPPLGRSRHAVLDIHAEPTSAQPVPLELAGARPRQRLAELHRPRPLVRGDHLRDEVLQFPCRDLAGPLRVEDDEGLDDHAP